MIDMPSKRNNTSEDHGFALLYTVVVIAIVSSLGTVLSGLIVREADLSATSRQSSLAYYSADAGVECAQYWDIKEDHFPRNPNHEPTGYSLNCAGASFDITSPNGAKEYNFTLNTSDICAKVTVTKSTSGGRRETTINSVGSDRCGVNTRVQRALRNSY